MEGENNSSNIKNDINLLTRRLGELNISKRQKINEISEIKKEIRRFLSELKESKRPKISEEIQKTWDNPIVILEFYYGRTCSQGWWKRVQC